MRGHEERTAVGVECKASFVRFPLDAESNEVGDGALIPMMGPDEALSGKGAESGKSFPVPWYRADSLREELPDAGGIDPGHQPAAGTPGPFTCVRMN